MATVFNTISILDWFRMFMVYGHVMISALALVTVLKADIKMVVSGISSDEIESDGKIVFSLLAALWVTGLTIIFIDTGFSAAVLMEKSKLLLKLACVLALTANGMVLHFISLPILERDTVNLSYRESLLLSVTGSLSTSHWMLAAFVGMSAPLGRFSFSTLASAYGAFIVLVLIVAVCFVAAIRRVKVGISGRRASDPPAKRRKKLLDELVATPRTHLGEVGQLGEAANRGSDRDEQQSKQSHKMAVIQKFRKQG